MCFASTSQAGFWFRPKWERSLAFQMSLCWSHFDNTSFTKCFFMITFRNFGEISHSWNKLCLHPFKRMRLVCGQVVWSWLICRPDPQAEFSVVTYSSILALLCFSVLGVSGWNTAPPPFGTMLHTSLPEVMELEGNYLLTKQAETTVLDILLKYLNFPRNPEKIIPWGSVMNEGMAFQSPWLGSSHQSPNHYPLAWWRGALVVLVATLGIL